MKFKILLLVLALALCAAPALAQTTTTNTVAYNGFTFSFPSSLASSVSITQVAGDPATLQSAGGPQVKHTEFVLYNGAAPQSLFDGVGGIQVYSTADFAGYQQAAQEFQNLQTLIVQQPDLTPYMVGGGDTNANYLPFLPTMPAAQVIRARASYVTTPSLKGVSYITAYRSDVSPFTGSDFIYTFQGLSADGSTYVVAIFRPTTTLFPAQTPSNFDYDTFGQQLASYYTQSISTLNSAAPDSFSPSLSDFDALIQSFGFSGATTTQPQQPPAPTLEPTPTLSDVTMGGLAEMTWTLVSYGDPTNPTPVAQGSALTLTFSQTGVSGNGGCNGFGGSFQYSSSTLTIGSLVHTMMACTDQSLMDQENAYLDALSKASSFQINGNQLQISYDGGVLTFTGS